MISGKKLTQEDIDKIMKEVEEQVSNEPVYEKPIKEAEEIIGVDKIMKEVEEQIANEPVYKKPIKEDSIKKNEEVKPIGYSKLKGVITSIVTEFK